MYSDTSRVRKVLVQQTTQVLGLQKKVCARVDELTAAYLAHFGTLDRLHLHIINVQLTAQNFLALVRLVVRTTFCCNEFSLVFVNGSGVDWVSSMAEVHLDAERARRVMEAGTAAEVCAALGVEGEVHRTRHSVMVFHGQSTAFAREHQSTFTPQQVQLIND